MLRERFSRMLSYSGLATKARRAFIGTLSLSFASSFVADPLKKVKKYDELYDLAVVGGGSGGLATAFEANKHGLNVLVIDFVEESIHKTKWGLGGTCVNVGCIPKKLMHQSAKAREELVNASEYGWKIGEVAERTNEHQLLQAFSWKSLRSKIQGYIKSINFSYQSDISSNDNMQYLNCLATFKDKNTLIASKDRNVIYNYIKDGTLPPNDPEKPVYYEIKAKNFLISTGTRPTYFKVEGAQHAITSDDIFHKKEAPGKTLIVGGGYVAVEIAGFLNGMGYNVSMMTRGEYLRAFDRDMVQQVIGDLRRRQVNIVETSLPQKISKREDGKLEVTVRNQQTNELSKPEEFDTVLFATGRTATTDTLNLAKIGVQLAGNKKVLPRKGEVERTNLDHIYALGDVVEGLPELTSTATKMGWHLGRRIVQRLGVKQFQDRQLSVSLDNYPTTIFTPLEYSCSGLSEEQAISAFGRDDVLCYHIKYRPLEESILDKFNEDGTTYKVDVYAKAIVQKSTDKVLGLHYAGPHAGEVMQGFAVALRVGLTKHQLDSTIGIHPTVAEELTNMTVTKESGLPFEKANC